MAHAYTTKRGKNKLSKLGVRKDQQQNQERSIKTQPNLSAFLYDGPKEPVQPVLGRLGNHNLNAARLENVKTRLQKAIMDKCSNPDCPEASSGALSECAACHDARYCSRDCQKAHWPNHKARCKEVRKELEQKEQNNQQKLLDALKELGLENSNAEDTNSDSKRDEVEAEVNDSDEIDEESTTVDEVEPPGEKA